MSHRTSVWYHHIISYHGRFARRKPLYHVLKSPNIWHGVIFSEESSFSQLSARGRIWIWKKLSQEFSKNNEQPIIKHLSFRESLGNDWNSVRSAMLERTGDINAAICCQHSERTSSHLFQSLDGWGRHIFNARLHFKLCFKSNLGVTGAKWGLSFTDRKSGTLINTPESY